MDDEPRPSRWPWWARVMVAALVTVLCIVLIAAIVLSVRWICRPPEWSKRGRVSRPFPPDLIRPPPDSSLPHPRPLARQKRLEPQAYEAALYAPPPPPEDDNKAVDNNVTPKATESPGTPDANPSTSFGAGLRLRTLWNKAFGNRRGRRRVPAGRASRGGATAVAETDTRKLGLGFKAKRQPPQDPARWLH